MRRYAFLLSGTWLGWLALCVAFALACVFLGHWQLDRREQAMEEINRVVANYDEPAIEYSAARELFAAPTEDDEWRVVQMTGQYRPDDTLLVRNRAHQGSIGYEVLVPFEEAGTGDILIVDRGWLPTASDDGSRPAHLPDPPAGEVELDVRVKPSEAAIDRDAPQGQVASIDLPEIQDDLGYPIMDGAYALMGEESPAPGTQPSQLSRPALDEGPHLSYSLQWYAFGLLSFIGWGYAARLHARSLEADASLGLEEEARHSAHGTSRRERLREIRRRERIRSGKLTDEDYEDAWVERHSGSR